MDFTLSNEQRSWQMTARKFAEEEIRPISVERDEISDPRATFDWEIIKKGSRLGFRTMAVPKEWGGHGTDFVTQALVMTELAKADSAISKTFSQMLEVESPDRSDLHRRAEAALLAAVPGGRHLSPGKRHQRAECAAASTDVLRPLGAFPGGAELGLRKGFGNLITSGAFFARPLIEVGTSRAAGPAG